MLDVDFKQAEFMATLNTEEIIKLYELVVQDSQDGADNLIEQLSFNSYEFRKLTQQYSLGYQGEFDQNLSSVVVRCSFDKMPWSYEHIMQDLS